MEPEDLELYVTAEATRGYFPSEETIGKETGTQENIKERLHTRYRRKEVRLYVPTT